MSASARFPSSVRIVEVGPRDGLQNESAVVPAAVKVAFIEALLAAGHRHVEVTSFVSPERVPQLADAEEVFRALPRPAGVTLTALVPNARGMERAMRAGARSVAVFVGASDAFNRANIGCTTREALERFEPVARWAAREDVTLRGYVSTAFVCPYSGRIAPREAADLALRLRDLGASEVALSDTLGAADPLMTDRLLDELEGRFPFEALALHLHDTYGRALANATVGLLRGVTVLDSSAGGLGGCPYAPGAKGNLATEDLLAMLDSMGIATGIDLEKHRAATALIREALGTRGDSPVE